jgi:2-phospho-L-lactate guanylyltransferase (CobY/MobA/RfbA family)
MPTPTEDLQAVRSRLNELEAELVAAKAANADLQSRLDNTLSDEERADLATLADACRAASGSTDPVPVIKDATVEEPTATEPSLIDRL